MNPTVLPQIDFKIVLKYFYKYKGSPVFIISVYVLYNSLHKA